MKKICIIEDNSDVRSTISIIFKTKGFEVFEFENGVEALQEIEAILPDVSIIDLGLPLMNGTEVASKIRRLPCGDKMIIACLTGSAAPESNLDFDLTLAKPFRLKEIFEQVEAKLESGREPIRRPLAG